MADAVSRCDIEVNGQTVKVKNFKEHKREFRAPIKIMKGSITVTKTPQYLFSVDYPVLKSVTPYPWESFVDGTFTVIEEGGARITFSPASMLEIGESTLDDENEKVQTIEFWSEDRTEE
jgi:hypothetical protein